MVRKLIVGLIVLSLGLWGLAGPGYTQAQKENLVIAVAGPLTGTSAQDGNAIKNGAALAADLINKKGGVKGQNIQIVAEDDRSDPKEAANVANKLANDKKVLAVIGHFNSSCTLAGAPIYNRAKVVEISAGSTSPAVSQAGPYTFRVIVTDAFQGDFVARWMVKEEGLKKIAILYENDDYGVGLKDVMTKKIAANGGQVAGLESYYLGETKDFTPYITKLKAVNPDAVFIAGLYNEAALIAKQAADVGWNPALFGVDGIYSTALVDLGGKAVEGTRVAGFFHPALADPVVQQFVQDFKAKYNKEPGTYEAFGYDAMLVLAAALEKGGTNREAVKNCLTTLKGLKGVTGLNSFDENGDVVKDPYKLIVRGGKFQPYKK
ncbi:MAG: ABC transporter substrate-binding protein [Thermodesulfobacteriota bacterium]